MHQQRYAGTLKEYKMKRKVGIRTYTRDESIVFHKTKESFGALSNMSAGFPITINGRCIPTSEALYQACRFPSNPSLQDLIISQTSPMTAKMRSKPYRHETRPDWLMVRVRIMRWCLQAKLLQNYSTFSQVLLDTGEKPIVEYSSKDNFWGAIPQTDSTLTGANVLGRLLMDLRLQLKQNLFSIDCLTPPDVEDFLLFNIPIHEIFPRTPDNDSRDLFL